MDDGEVASVGGQRTERASLEAARDEVSRRLASLTRDFDEIVEGFELVNTDDEHDPEGATIAYERAKVIALLRSTRQRLDALEAALRQLDEGGGYGTCTGCGEPIGAERLDALPGISTCVACADRGNPVR